MIPGEVLVRADKTEAEQDRALVEPQLLAQYRPVGPRPVISPVVAVWDDRGRHPGELRVSIDQESRRPVAE